MQTNISQLELTDSSPAARPPVPASFSVLHAENLHGQEWATVAGLHWGHRRLAS